MRLAFLAGPILATLTLPGAGAGIESGSWPAFKMQEFARDFTVGYAVKVVDVNGDGKPDIVVVDSRRVVWYENPTWKMRTMIQGQTVADNVCIDAADIDGDGQVGFALGAGWNPSNTNVGGTLQWLKRGKSIDDPWTLHPIDSEPTVHRLRFADIDGDGRPELIVVPLFGRGSSQKANHMDAPVRVLAYRIPKDPTRDRWQAEVLNHNLHVAHNFWPIAAANGKGKDILVASYEGVSLLSRSAEKWTKQQLGSGNQENPKGSRGASEIKQGKLKNGRRFIATIEPWHGHQVVVYTEPAQGGQLWDRHVIDDPVRWGHGVWCADLDGDGNDHIIVGIRGVGDDPEDKESRGVRIYRASDERGAAWVRHILDKGGVACEDLVCADLDGDGRIDIVAVGRQTHNGRIYWNLGR